MKLTLKNEKDILSTLGDLTQGDTFWYCSAVWMIIDRPTGDETFPISAVCLTDLRVGEIGSFKAKDEYESANVELIAEPQR